MKKYILAVVVALLSSQAYSQVVDDTTASHPAHHVKKKAAPVVENPRLPPPSKASLGFYEAAMYANYNMMELYLQQGADINCVNCDRDYQWTALYRALAINGAWNYQLADWLIQRRADINIPANISGQAAGSTLVMAAAGYNTVPNFQALDYLVKRGADVKSVDSLGRNALHYIREWDFIDTSGETSRQFVAFIDLLIQNNIDVNQQDKSGSTALMTATNHCSPGAVKLLISYGANSALKDKTGKSAIDIAMERATRSSQNSPCNDVIKILSATPQALTPAAIKSSGAPQNTPGNVYAGSYSGSYTGDDYGSFQVTIAQDGRVNLAGKSVRNNQIFSGDGKVSNDGSLGVSLGSVSSGATFQGSVNPKTGAMYGTWKNSGQAGNFSGNRQGQTNPLEVVGSILDGLSKILAP